MDQQIPNWAKDFKPRQNAPKAIAAEQPEAMDITGIEDMPRNELIKLVQKICAARWGMIAGMDKTSVAEALKLKAAHMALTTEDVKEFVAASEQWFNRELGKPLQSIDLNQKIGIVQIVLEASKQRNSSTTISSADGALLVHQEDKAL